MIHATKWKLALVASILSLAVLGSAPAAERKPNILFIMTGMKTSPGRFAGPDHGWTLTMYMTPALYPHFAEIEKIPNKPSKLRGGPFFMIPPENRP